MILIAKWKIVVTTELQIESFVLLWKKKFQVKASMHISPLLAQIIC